MSEKVQPVAEWAAALIEMLGVGAIVLAAAASLVLALIGLIRREDSAAVVRLLRERLGRGILLGLELVVAADIIHTVAVELTFETVTVLAIIVAIRTFLSFTLEVELTGRWPWEKKHDQRRASHETKPRTRGVGELGE